MPFSPSPLPQDLPPFPSFATDGHSRRRWPSLHNRGTGSTSSPLPRRPPGSRSRLIGHDGSYLGRHLVVVQPVPDRLVHELLDSRGHDRDDDPDLHRVAECLSELLGQSLGLFLPLHQLPLDIPQLFDLLRVRYLAHHPDGPRHRLRSVLPVQFAPSSKPFHVVHRPDQLQSFSSQILAQHVVDLRRVALDVFLGELLGQLLVTDLQPGFLNGRQDLIGRPDRPLEGERQVLLVLALEGSSRIGCQ